MVSHCLGSEKCSLTVALRCRVSLLDHSELVGSGSVVQRSVCSLRNGVEGILQEDVLVDAGKVTTTTNVLAL